MPITLPALTRRELLKQTTATGLSLLAGHHLHAAGDDLKKELWVLFSDTHIAEDQATVARDINLADHLKQAVKQVLELQQKEKAFGLFVNGDLAYDTGEKGDYATFVELMKPLRQAGIDVHLTLGNHDDREKCWDGCWELTTNHKLLPLKHLSVITSAVVNWVLLDSLDKTDNTPGVLGESQIAWLDRTLRDLPDRPTIIMVHHNPQGPVPEGGKRTGLTDTDEFMRVVDKHPKAKAWIFGHTHNWEIKTRKSGLHLVNLPPVAYAFNKARPSGWVTARVDAKGMDLELRSLDVAHPEHGKVTRIEWS
ncbi:MAG: metallophosphoesterase [Verrucomicrobiaceae bacterium]|nr:metallophosphoesterase [Verrucomicrobiaceae bacterium]